MAHEPGYTVFPNRVILFAKRPLDVRTALGLQTILMEHADGSEQRPIGGRPPIVGTPSPMHNTPQKTPPRRGTSGGSDRDGLLSWTRCLYLRGRNRPGKRLPFVTLQRLIGVERFFRDLTVDVVVREGSFTHVKQLCTRFWPTWPNGTPILRAMCGKPRASRFSARFTGLNRC